MNFINYVNCVVLGSDIREVAAGNKRILIYFYSHGVLVQ